MDDQDGTERRPARLRPELVDRDAVSLRLQAVVARACHEIGGARDGAAFRLIQLCGVGRAAEQFKSHAPRQPWRDTFAGGEYTADDLQAE
jgi:hypothetical protein